MKQFDKQIKEIEFKLNNSTLKIKKFFYKEITRMDLKWDIEDEANCIKYMVAVLKQWSKSDLFSFYNEFFYVQKLQRVA